MDALKNLELLITSRYPIIVVESYEGERVEQTLARVASRLGVPLWVWTVTRDLRRADTPGGMFGRCYTFKALGALEDMVVEFFF